MTSPNIAVERQSLRLHMPAVMLPVVWRWCMSLWTFLECVQTFTTLIQLQLLLQNCGGILGCTCMHVAALPPPDFASMTVYCCTRGQRAKGAVWGGVLVCLPAAVAHLWGALHAQRVVAVQAWAGWDVPAVRLGQVQLLRLLLLDDAGCTGCC